MIEAIARVRDAWRADARRWRATRADV